MRGQPESRQLRQGLEQQRLLDAVGNLQFVRDQPAGNLFLLKACINHLNGEELGERANDVGLAGREDQAGRFRGRCVGARAFAQGQRADQVSVEKNRMHQAVRTRFHPAQRVRMFKRPRFIEPHRAARGCGFQFDRAVFLRRFGNGQRVQVEHRFGRGQHRQPRFARGRQPQNEPVGAL